MEPSDANLFIDSFRPVIGLQPGAEPDGVHAINGVRFRVTRSNGAFFNLVLPARQCPAHDESEKRAQASCVPEGLAVHNAVQLAQDGFGWKLHGVMSILTRSGCIIRVRDL
jgi:hypothetical protein